MALDALSVVEILGSAAGGYAAKLLADQGATVTLVVASDGPPTDGLSSGGPATGGPSSGGPATGGLSSGGPATGGLSSGEPIPDGDGADALRLALDGAKRRHRGPCGPDELAALIRAADVVIESSAPDPLTPRAGPAGSHPGLDHDRLVAVRISPFGSTGPYRAWRSTDCTDHAIAGHLRLTGDPDREPLQGPAHQPAFAAGLHAAIGVLAALEARRTTGRGQTVEVTHHEVMVALHQFTLLRWTHSGDILNRMGNRYAGPGTPIGLYHCADGDISLTVPRDDQLERLLAAAGLLHLLDEPGIGSTYDLMHHPTLLEAHLVPWLAAQPAEETVELLQALRVPASPVRSMAGLLADPHLAERDVWVTHPDMPSLRLPRSPLRLTPLTPPLTSPAVDLAVGAAVGADPAADRAVDRSVERVLGGRDGPLQGLRVLDLTRVWAGPLATRILADLGADVVMVEAPWARGPAGIDRSSVEATHYYPNDDPGQEHWNRIGFVNKYAVNKRSVALDLSDPAAREAFEGLVAWADVVIENYSPRVMPQLGLDQDSLARINPAVIYVTMPGYGRTGPAVDWVAYGPMIDSHAGLAVLQGYRHEVARKGGVAWPDPVAGMHAAFAVLVAVAARRGHGSGRAAVGEGAVGEGSVDEGAVDEGGVGHSGGGEDGGGRSGEGALVVELAQLEATIALVGEAVARYQLSGVEPRPQGNRHPTFAPQGVYPAAGTDHWLALSVLDDEGWRALVAHAGFDPVWAHWTGAERRREHDRIDEALARWTASYDAALLAARLQAEGVAAAPVTDAPAVMADPHLLERGFFVPVAHPVAGTHLWPRCAVNLSATPATYRRPAPCLGQHNEEVLTACAGLTAAAIAELEQRGVLAVRPPA